MITIIIIWLLLIILIWIINNSYTGWINSLFLNRICIWRTISQRSGSRVGASSPADAVPRYGSSRAESAGTACPAPAVQRLGSSCHDAMQIALKYWICENERYTSIQNKLQVLELVIHYTTVLQILVHESAFIRNANKVRTYANWSTIFWVNLKENREYKTQWYHISVQCVTTIFCFGQWTRQVTRYLYFSNELFKPSLTKQRTCDWNSSPSGSSSKPPIVVYSIWVDNTTVLCPS